MSTLVHLLYNIGYDNILFIKTYTKITKSNMLTVFGNDAYGAWGLNPETVTGYAHQYKIWRSCLYVP